MKSSRMISQISGARRSLLSCALPAKPLPAAERAYFENRLGQDFSRVRLHTGAQAAGVAGALGAKAFASGEDIVFGDGRYQPGGGAGRELLGHELAHVAQQRQGGGAPAQAEARASSAAGTLAQGGSVAPQALGGVDAGIHCDPEDKKPGDTPSSSVLPPFQPFKLTTPPPIDWLKMRDPYTARGLRLGDRDASGIEAEADRIANQLSVFGIDKNFKLDLGFMKIDRDWIINKGLSKQLDFNLGRDNPTALDRMNQDFDRTHPGFSTPIVGPSWNF